MDKKDLLLSLGVLAVGAVVFNEATKRKPKKGKKNLYVVNGKTYPDNTLAPLENLRTREAEKESKTKKIVPEIYERPNDVLLSAVKETLNLATKKELKYTRKEFQSEVIQAVIKKTPTTKYSEFLPDIPMTVEDLEKKIHHMKLDEKYQAVLKA
jgi:hypothetical protein